jgi:hypothetical protein
MQNIQPIQQANISDAYQKFIGYNNNRYNKGDILLLVDESLEYSIAICNGMKMDPNFYNITYIIRHNPQVRNKFYTSTVYITDIVCRLRQTIEEIKEYKSASEFVEKHPEYIVFQ